MPLEYISRNVVTTITQNVAYALPPGLNFIRSNTALEDSLDNSTWTALAGANTTGINTGAKFVRCTTANALVNVKAYTNG